MCDSQNRRAGHPDAGNIQPFRVLLGYVGVYLALADSEHFRATGRAYALSCRLAILHGDAFGIFHFLLGTALHAISLHIQASSLVIDLTLNHLLHPGQAGSYRFGNKKG